MTEEPNGPFTILCVCTGNICRSPAAERLLSARLGPEVRVASAGTLGLVDQGIQPEMAAHLSLLGLPDAGFAARRLTATDVRDSDLVLGLGREHRSAAVELVPAAVRRAFTLREFARLLSDVEPSELPDGTAVERLTAAVPLVASRRRRIAAPDLDDVVDPYRLSQQVYDESFLAIRTAVDVIGDRIVPHSG